jgi:hypothetical protein
VRGERRFVDPPTSKRCTANVVLGDGTGAACGHTARAGTDRCWQHPRIYACPFCEHMPDGADVKLCARHAKETP